MAFLETLVTNAVKAALDEPLRDLKDELKNVERDLKGELKNLKGELKNVEQDLKGELKDVEERLGKRIDKMEHRLDVHEEKCEKRQSKNDKLDGQLDILIKLATRSQQPPHPALEQSGTNVVAEETDQ